MSEVYQVELDAFTGPLDLLLHLVKREQVNIYDIPIAKITAEYMAYLARFSELDLDTAADFLVLAATLLAIKARLLLPACNADPENTEEAGEDPREELVRRLVIYRRFKEAAGWLAERLEGCNRTFDRTPGQALAALPQAPPDPGDSGGDKGTLILAYEAVMAAAEVAEPEHTVSPEGESLSVRMQRIIGQLERVGYLSFRGLLAKRASRRDIVITFLALLELVRQGRVKLVQGNNCGRLEIFKTAAEPAFQSEVPNDER